MASVSKETSLERVQRLKAMMQKPTATNKHNQLLLDAMIDHSNTLTAKTLQKFDTYKVEVIREPQRITLKTFCNITITRSNSVNYFGKYTLKWVWLYLGGTEESFINKFLDEVGYDDNINKNAKKRRSKHRSNSRQPKIDKFKPKPKTQPPKQFTRIHRKKWKEFENKYKQLIVYSEKSKKKINPSPNAIKKLLDKATDDDWETGIPDVSVIILVATMVWLHNGGVGDTVSKSDIVDDGLIYFPDSWKIKPVINARGSLLILTKIFDSNNKYNGMFKINEDWLSLFQIWVKDENKILKALKTRKENDEKEDEQNIENKENISDHKDENIENISDQHEDEHVENIQNTQNIQNIKHNKPNNENKNYDIISNKEVVANFSDDQSDEIMSDIGNKNDNKIIKHKVKHYTLSDISDISLVECLKTITKSAELSQTCLQYLIQTEFEYSELKEFEEDELKEFVLTTLKLDILRFRRLVKYIKNN
eukprot:207015_1